MFALGFCTSLVSISLDFEHCGSFLDFERSGSTSFSVTDVLTFLLAAAVDLVALLFVGLDATPTPSDANSLRCLREDFLTALEGGLLIRSSLLSENRAISNYC